MWRSSPIDGNDSTSADACFEVFSSIEFNLRTASCRSSYLSFGEYVVRVVVTVCSPLCCSADNTVCTRGTMKFLQCQYIIKSVLNVNLWQVHSLHATKYGSKSMLPKLKFFFEGGKYTISIRIIWRSEFGMHRQHQMTFRQIHIHLQIGYQQNGNQHQWNAKANGQALFKLHRSH